MVLSNKDNIETEVITSADFTLDNIEELKSSKDVRISGFISTSKIDTNRDVVTDKGQDSLVRQIKERASEGKHITMDLDHESFERDPSNPLKSTGKILNKIPVARIEDVMLERDGEVTRTKVTALVNKDHPLYKSIIGSMKNGFLHSFSIVYKVTSGYLTNLNGVTTRVIDDLLLRNVGITGAPVQDDAKFQLSLKSYYKKMEQEEKITNLETSVLELKSQLETSSSELKSQLTEKETVITELKSQLKTSETAMDSKLEALKVEELKSKVEGLVTSNTEMKSFIEELKSKGLHKAVPQTAPAQVEELPNFFTKMG